jgi:ABC-type transporter Mla MlaB component
VTDAEDPPGPVANPATAPGSEELELRLRTPLSRTDVAALCSEVAAVLAHARPGPLFLHLIGIEDPDLIVVDALARLQLTARRLGRTVVLRHACPQLRGLLFLCGLHDVLPVADDRPRQPGRR